MLHVCLGRLRLDPKSLWAMSPREVHALMGGLGPGRAPISRADLAGLMARYPDFPPSDERNRPDG